MSYPVQAPTPSYTGTMVPEIWSPKLLWKFYNATVLADISNTDYEGEIANQGDVVHIRTTPDIVIQAYLKGQQINYQQPTPNTVDLAIDKGHYWAFRDDYVDRVQADYNYIEDWTDDASMQMKEHVDASVLQAAYGLAHAGNAGAAAGAISNSYNLGAPGGGVVPVSGVAAGGAEVNIVDLIADLGSTLDEQNVPEEGRWLVLPAWAINRVQKSWIKHANEAGDDTSVARNGRIGQIDRFTIYRSNQLAVTGVETNAMFGHPCALTFAAQLVESEGPLLHADYFGRFYRGLNVYGWNVIKPEALGHLVIQPA